MKYFLLLVVVLAVLWLMGGTRRRQVRSFEQRREVLPEPRDMVPCQICQVHIDKDHALLGPGGYYCCHQHRDQA